MDHLYIDGERIPELYVAGGLTLAEREAFEAHLVDCAECADRILLAEWFHARNGRAALAPLSKAERIPAHARFVAQFRAWEFGLLLGMAGAALLGVSTLIYLWELGRL